MIGKKFFSGWYYPTTAEKIWIWIRQNLKANYDYELGVFINPTNMYLMASFIDYGVNKAGDWLYVDVTFDDEPDHVIVIYFFPFDNLPVCEIG